MSRPASKLMVESTPPPATPEIAEGSTLGQLKTCMDGNAFMILLDLTNWANQWDAMYTGKTEWNDASIRFMMYPFLGFGNNPRLYGVVSEKVKTLVGVFAPQWLRDPVYRKANSMTWCVISMIGPQLAAESHGADGQNKALDIIAAGLKE